MTLVIIGILYESEKRAREGEKKKKNLKRLWRVQKSTQWFVVRDNDKKKPVVFFLHRLWFDKQMDKFIAYIIQAIQYS